MGDSKMKYRSTSSALIDSYCYLYLTDLQNPEMNRVSTNLYVGYVTEGVIVPSQCNLHPFLGLSSLFPQRLEEMKI